MTLLYPLELVTPPVEEPVTVEEVKSYGWIYTDQDDALIEGLIKAVRGRLEDLTDLQLVTATYKLYLDRFPGCPIMIPKSPLQAVSTIVYIDAGGVEQTWDEGEYIVDTASRPGSIYLGFEQAWPGVQAQTNAVAITFTAGFGTAADVPAEIKQRIWQGVKYRYYHRDESNEKWLDSFLSANWPGWMR